MRLFSADLFRNFGFGFAFGAMLILGANMVEGKGPGAGPAQAAEVIKTPAPAADFVIAPSKG